MPNIYQSGFTYPNPNQDQPPIPMEPQFTAPYYNLERTGPIAPYANVVFAGTNNPSHSAAPESATKRSRSSKKDQVLILKELLLHTMKFGKNNYGKLREILYDQAPDIMEELRKISKFYFFVWFVLKKMIEVKIKSKEVYYLPTTERASMEQARHLGNQVFWSFHLLCLVI